MGMGQTMHGQQVATSKGPARALRKGLTDAERKLWQRLRGEQLGVKFRRQHPYLDFVLDFVCLERHLVIEVDGGQHLGRQSDAARDAALAAAGFRTLRFWNDDVLLRTDAVVETIWTTLNPSPPPPSP